jgi:hypothetical protein
MVEICCWMGRAGLVQLVSASSPSHQVLGSKPSLCRISAGVRLCFGYSLPQTPLVWEPLALGLPFFICCWMALWGLKDTSLHSFVCFCVLVSTMYEQLWCSTSQCIPSWIESNLKSVKQHIPTLELLFDSKEKASRWKVSLTKLVSLRCKSNSTYCATASQRGLYSTCSVVSYLPKLVNTCNFCCLPDLTISFFSNNY